LKHNPLGLSFWLLCIGFVAPIAFGVYLAYHPPKPVVKTVTTTVKEPIPCPAIKTGPATAKAGKGGTAIGHSGNGDTYNVPPPKDQ